MCLAPTMLGELCKQIRHCCATFQGSQNRNVGSCLLKSLTSFELCATTPNNMQQGVQMDATCNVQRSMLFANNVASVCTGLYSGSSPNGHSYEWTALLTAAFSKPVCLTFHTNSVLNSRKRPAPVTDTFFVFRGCPLQSSHCS